jgi:hypothetical protein
MLDAGRGHSKHRRSGGPQQLLIAAKVHPPLRLSFLPLSRSSALLKRLTSPVFDFRAMAD